MGYNVTKDDDNGDGIDLLEELEIEGEIELEQLESLLQKRKQKDSR